MIDAMDLSPEECQGCFIYLDALRESGDTNMFGAGQYLQREFGFSRYTAKDILLTWMKTYAERHPRSG